MLEMLISSKSRAAILELFYLNPDAKFHLREVSRRLEINTNQARRELERLNRAGIVKKERVGNLHLYEADRRFTFYKELSAIAAKSAGFEQVIANALARIKGISFAFIFGSYAEGKLGPKSDIDLMIIGEPDGVQLNNAINQVERRLRRPVQYMVYPLAEFRKKRGYGFVKNVMERKKIMVAGDLDELERA